MDSDFMNNLNNMLNSGKLPNNIKDLLNNFKSNNLSNPSSSNDSDNYNHNNDDETDSNNSGSNNNSVSTNTINPDMLKNMMNMLNNSNFSNSGSSNNDINFNVSNSNSGSIDSGGDNSSNGFGNIDMNMILKMKMIMDKMKDNKNDPRANLLLSLKPYLKESRKNKVEQYIQLFSMSKIMDVFNQNGGENTR